MRGHAISSCFAASLAACVPRLEVELPDPEGASASIVILGTPPGGARGEPTPGPAATRPAEVWAYGAGSDGELPDLPLVTLDHGEVVTVLYYERTLDDLALSPGRQELVEAPAGRPIPQFDRGFRYAIDPERDVAGPGDFDVVLPTDEQLLALRLAHAATELACATLGGCYDEPTPEDLRCKLDCSPPVPTPPELPAAPRPVEPPRLLPCAEGWSTSRTEHPTLETCRPPPRPAEVPCPRGQRQPYGSDHCEPLGSPCPDGQFTEDPPADRPLVFVDGGASPGGDGTLERPLVDLAEAVLLAPAGAAIILSKGTHTGGVELPAGIAVLGACAAETTVVAGRGPEVLVTLGPGVLVGDLALRGGAVGAVARGTGSELTLSGVHVEGSTVAISAEGGALVEARGVSLRGTGTGLTTLGPSRLELAGAEVLDVHGGAIFVSGGPGSRSARVNAEDVVVRRSRSRPGTPGFGLMAHTASITGARLHLEDNQSHAILLGGAVTATLTDVFASSAVGSAGRGVYATDGAKVRLVRAHLSRTALSGISVFGPGTRVRVEDSLIEDTRLDPSNQVAFGIDAYSEARIEVERTVIARTRGNAVILTSSASAALSDAVISGVSARPDGQNGFGIQLINEASAEVHRTVVHRSTGCAVQAVLATAGLQDLAITDTSTAERDDVSQAALEVVASHVLLERGALERNTTIGVRVDGGGSLEASDLRIAGTHPGRGGAWSSLALLVVNASARVERGELRANRRGALQAYTGGEVELVDVTVEGSGEVATGIDGAALAIDAGGALTGARILVERSANVALRVAGDYDDARSRLEVTDVTVRDIEGVGIEAASDAFAVLDRVSIERVLHQGLAISNGVDVTMTNLRIHGVEAEGSGLAVGFHLSDGPERVHLSSFAISGSEGYGIALEGGAFFNPQTFEMSDGTVSNNAVGLRNAAPRITFAKLMNRVVYIENREVFEQAR